MSVALNGDVQFCSYTNGVLGNLHRTSLTRLWEEHPQYKLYRSEEWLPDRCRGCTYLSQCRCGCKMSRHGDTFEVDELFEPLREPATVRGVI